MKANEISVQNPKGPTPLENKQCIREYYGYENSRGLGSVRMTDMRGRVIHVQSELLQFSSNI